MAGISDKRHSALDRTFSEDIQAQPDRPFRDLLGQHIIVTSVYLLSDSEAARWQELSRNIDDAFLEKFDTVISECKQSGQWKKFRDQVAQHIRESETKTILARQFSSGSPEDDDATTKSWNEPFRGQSAEVLKRTIINHANKPFQAQNLYAFLLSIVQSSGTGKSRLLDELAFTMPVVSLNTRPALSDGFPAADSAARDFFTLTDWDQAERRYLCFLFALFEVLYDYLSFKLDEKLDPDQKTWPIAMKLRHLMTFKQEYSKQGPLRVEFYDSVISKAKEHLKAGKSIRSESLYDRATALAVFLPSGMPLILAIDEAHGLVGSHAEPGFIHLRHQLHEIVSCNRIFTVLISTTAKIHRSYKPPIPIDPSARRGIEGMGVLPPFTALGFDQLAYQSVKANVLTMDRIISDEFMCQMGRPLFGSRFNNGTKSVKDGILRFAVQKLLGGGQLPTDSLPAAATLACLGTRLALPFNTTSLDQQLPQVEHHLRVCITIKEDMETAITIAASEPIVAEASAFITSSLRPRKRLAQMLKDTLDGTPSLDLGDRGESAGLLLLTMTRDVLVYPPPGGIHPDRRSIPLVTFLKTLLCIENLEKALPVNVVDGGKVVPFGEAFEHSRIHFNHFIKATDYDVINRKYLWKIASRAAGIVCARNQLGVDAILVGILDHRKPLGPDNIVILLFQMKNNVKMKARYKGRLFHVMDPYLLGIFDESEGPCPIPVIRLVFALGSSQSTAYALEPRNPSRSGCSGNVKSKKTTFTSFDIWAAGATRDTFPVIEKDSSTFGELLQHDGYWSAHYQPVSQETPEIEALKRSLNPASCSRHDHWAFIEMEADDGKMKVDPKSEAKAAKMDMDSDVEEEQSEKDAMEVT